MPEKQKGDAVTCEKVQADKVYLKVCERGAHSTTLIAGAHNLQNKINYLSIKKKGDAVTKPLGVKYAVADKKRCRWHPKRCHRHPHSA